MQLYDSISQTFILLKCIPITSEQKIDLKSFETLLLGSRVVERIKRLDMVGYGIRFVKTNGRKNEFAVYSHSE